MSITIDILHVQRITVEDVDLDVREAKIRVTDGVDGYLHKVGGLPVIGDLQTILDNHTDQVWADAQAKGHLIADADLILALLERVGFAAVYVALVRRFTKEINKLRVLHSLPEYTQAQVQDALLQDLIDEVTGD